MTQEAQEEVEVLKSIYGDAFKDFFIKDQCICFSIELMPSTVDGENFVGLRLKYTLPQPYPAVW